MATQYQAVTDAPADVVVGLALADGAEYLVQVVGREAVRLAEAAAPPPNRSHSHIVLPGQTWTVEVSGPLWAWCFAGQASGLAVTEAS